MITCGFCGREFHEDRGQPACQGCPLQGGCRYVRCPYCGYENPAPPRWLITLQERWKVQRQSGSGDAAPPAEDAGGTARTVGKGAGHVAR